MCLSPWSSAGGTVLEAGELREGGVYCRTWVTGKWGRTLRVRTWSTSCQPLSLRVEEMSPATPESYSHSPCLAPASGLCLLWWTASPFSMWKQTSPLSCSERYFDRVTRKVTKLSLSWESRLQIMMMSPHVGTYHKFKVLPSIFNRDMTHPNINNILHFKCSCYCEPRFWNINHDLLF